MTKVATAIQRRPLIEPTDDAIRAAHAFVVQKWAERAKSRGESTPRNMVGACKFASLFAQRLFGGRLRGNYDHQWLETLNGQRIDLAYEGNEGAGITHDQGFWGIRDHEESLRSCVPRVDQWVGEFMAKVENDSGVRSNPPANVIYNKGGCVVEIVTPDNPGRMKQWRDTFIHFTDDPADASAIAAHGFDLSKFGRTGERYSAAKSVTEHDPRGVYAYTWEEGAERRGNNMPYIIFTAPIMKALYYESKPRSTCGKSVISAIHGGKTGVTLAKALLKDGIQAIFSKDAEQIILDIADIEQVGGHGMDY